MKNKYLLPYTEPEIPSQHTITFPFSVLHSYIESGDYDKWVSSHSINCEFSRLENEQWFKLKARDNWGVCNDFCIYQTIDLYKEAYDKCSIDIIDSIKRFIQNGVYVEGICESSILHGQMHTNRMVNYLIVGFDDDSRIFNIKIIDNKLNYYSHNISYPLFLKALLNMCTSKISFHLFKCVYDKHIELDINDMLTDLELYISTNKNKHISSGICAMQDMLDALLSQVENGINVSIEYIKVYVQQKNILYKRLKYLLTIKYIDVGIFNAFIPIYNNSIELYNIASIYNESNTSYVCINRLKNIINLSKAYVVFELRCISLIIKKLKNHC